MKFEAVWYECGAYKRLIEDHELDSLSAMDFFEVLAQQGNSFAAFV